MFQIWIAYFFLKNFYMIFERDFFEFKFPVTFTFNSRLNPERYDIISKWLENDCAYIADGFTAL